MSQLLKWFSSWEILDGDMFDDMFTEVSEEDSELCVILDMMNSGCGQALVMIKDFSEEFDED